MKGVIGALMFMAPLLGGVGYAVAMGEWWWAGGIAVYAVVGALLVMSPPKSTGTSGAAVRHVRNR